MNLLKQLLIIFCICIAGQLISGLLPIPFPSSVISLILLLVLLIFHLIKLNSIKEVSEFLLANMAFFFIPAGVNIMEHFETIKKDIPVLLFICIVTTFLTFAASAYTVIGVTKLMNRREKRNDS